MKRMLIILLLILCNAAYFMSIEDVKHIANNEIDEMVSNNVPGNWGVNSIVSELFPIYMDGYSEIAYYECKISTDGEDAGYILINVNKMDIPIVESSQYGKTLTEKYRQHLGYSDFKIFRYDWIRSAAVSNRISRSANSCSDILATLGFEDIESNTGHMRSASTSAQFLSRS